MKRLILTSLMVLFTWMVIACDFGGNDTPLPDLATPENLVIETRTLSWSAVPTATAYRLTINGELQTVTDTSFTLEAGLYGAFEVTVRAVRNGDVSPASEVLSFTLTPDPDPDPDPDVLDAPENLVFADGVLQWSPVTSATGYTVLIAGETYTVETNSFTVPSGLTGDLTVSVWALGDGVLTEDSAATTLQINLETPVLARVDNLRIENGTLMFDPVEGAESYIIYVDGAPYATVDGASYTLPTALLEGDPVMLQVRATAAHADPSALSEAVYLGITRIDSESALRAMTLSGAYELATDITLTEPWLPIPFNGLFDGAGHTIEGIVITADQGHVGFFSSLDGAHVSNVTLIGTMTVTLTEVDPHIGGLAALVKDTHIHSVYIHMDIDVTVLNGVGRLGGAVGALHDSVLEQVHFRGDIEAHHAQSGGLIGRAVDPSKDTVIHRASAEGSLIVHGGEQSHAGGFIGFMRNNQLTITESYARMDVTGASYVGGFVGYLGSGHIADSYASGSVLALNSVLVHAGGFIGRLEGYNVTVTRSIAQGNVSATHTGAMILTGSFSGYTPGGTFVTLYEDALYDNTVSSLDRIGNPETGRGDGIIGLALVAGELPEAYSEAIWNVTETLQLLWED
ncbi:MAG: hypothetical protein EA374_03640 [Acholeplasmatales bacterium]|nr:MAG: hypothetical protein EA374_03640 [Acholeplasmatales bacterium]